MEHREMPRLVSGEARLRDATAQPEADRHRFVRFVTLPERRLVHSRLGLAIAASVLALIAVGVVGSHVIERVVRWLHGQPEYRATFGAIVLDPPPPAWYRGESAVFLERVRQGAERGDAPFSALDLDLAALLRDFRLYGWVKRAVWARRKWPNRIIVRLEYRRPVGRASIRGRAVPVLLDEEGVVLPFEDVDEEKAWPLIPIVGLDAPFEPRAGHVWLTDEAAQGIGKADPGVLGAAKLAGFLNSVLAREPKPIPPALLPGAIHVSPSEEKNKKDIFYQNAENTLIYWAEPPEMEAPGRRTAGQRWHDLHRWIERRPDTPVVPPSYLDFAKDGVVIKVGKIRGEARRD